ncbi:MAG: hypothetical protein K6F50_04385 [Kiritimatiellae bacterium]|nr:hypothetical protein [Kiritimatiellia bacterium]
MNADLENTLAEMGDGYREVVDRLRRPFEEGAASGSGGSKVLPSIGWRRPALAAAALAAACFFAVHIVGRGNAPEGERASAQAPEAEPPVSTYKLALSHTPAAIDEIIRTQGPDGSWANDFLTRQNAAALRGVAGAAVPYRRALRYLRMRGLSPLTDAELRSRAANAVASL